MVKLIIEHNGEIYEPVLKDSVSLKSVRKGEPKTLTFTLIRDEIIQYEEGDPVRLIVDGANAFYGFIFKISGNKTNERQITAYDQIRYLKNKGSYNIEKWRVDTLIREIAEDTGLQVGTLANTDYLYSAVEDNVSFLDMILNAMDETTRQTGMLYVLYDDNGKLCLDNIADRKLDILLDESTGEDYSYSSSIDGETYNSIALYKDGADGGAREYKYASDINNINKWGLLRYFDTYDDNFDGQTKAQQLLELYNQRERGFSLSNQLGDIRVMGGTLVPVVIDVGDVKVSNYLMVEEVTHEISDNHHTMTLTLKGGEFTE